MEKKTFGIQLKQCLLWAQLSNFNLIKVGYYPLALLALIAIAFKAVHCLLIYIIYCVLVLYIRCTNVQSYDLRGHALNCPLFVYDMWYGPTLCKI